MSLPPLPSFGDIYEGRKLRTLVQTIENALTNLSRLLVQIQMVPGNRTFMTTTGNQGSAETTLFTSLAKGNRIRGDGWQFKVKTYGTFAGNANAKQIRLKLNNTVIFDSGAIAVNGGTWNIEAMIVRDGSNLQKNVVTVMSNNASFPTTAIYSTSTEDFTQDITLSVTATGVVDNDIVGEVLVTNIQPNL